MLIVETKICICALVIQREFNYNTFKAIIPFDRNIVRTLNVDIQLFKIHTINTCLSYFKLIEMFYGN